MRRILLTATAILLVIATVVLSQRARRLSVGPAENGGFLLNTGWRIRPAGKDIPLSTLPMSHALAPDGRRLAVLNGGYNPAAVSLIDVDSSREITRAQLGDGWRGLAFSPAGDKLYAGNGSRGSITEFSVQ